MTAPDSDSSPHQYDKADLQHSNISRQPSIIMRSSSSNGSTPHHNPREDYPSDNFHHPSSSNGTEHSIHPQPYHNQSYQPEFQQHLPYSYPSFHSYPSFTESNLPTAPSHYPSYRQSSDDSYPNLPPSITTSYPSSAQNDSVARNGSVSEPSSTTIPEYEYDSNYEPPPGQIAEAQKAARFAVSALAFDDVFVAVDFLKKSLELLTKPSAGHWSGAEILKGTLNIQISGKSYLLWWLLVFNWWIEQWRQMFEQKSFNCGHVLCKWYLLNSNIFWLDVYADTAFTWHFYDLLFLLAFWLRQKLHIYLSWNQGRNIPEVVSKKRFYS